MSMFPPLPRDTKETADAVRLRGEALDAMRKDPQGALNKARRSAEALAIAALHREGVEAPRRPSLGELVTILESCPGLNSTIFPLQLKLVQRYGNHGSHYQQEQHLTDPVAVLEQATPCITVLDHALLWFHARYHPNAEFKPFWEEPARLGASQHSGLIDLRRLSDRQGASATDSEPPPTGRASLLPGLPVDDSPRDLDARLYAGLCNALHHEVHGDVSGALREYQRLIDVVQAQLGTRDARQQAILFARRIAQLGPESPVAFVCLAELLQSERQVARAVDAFARALQLYEKRGDMHHYVVVAERLLNFQPDNGALRRELARAYLDTGDWARAVRALARLPRDEITGDDFSKLATSLEAMGQTSRAVAAWTEAVRLARHAGNRNAEREATVRIAALRGSK